MRRNKNRAIPTGGKKLRKQEEKFLTALKLRVRKDLSASKLQKQSPGAKAQIEKMVDRLKNTPAQKAKMSLLLDLEAKCIGILFQNKDRISKMRKKK